MKNLISHVTIIQEDNEDYLINHNKELKEPNLSFESKLNNKTRTKFITKISNFPKLELIEKDKISKINIKNEESVNSEIITILKTTNIKTLRKIFHYYFLIFPTYNFWKSELNR